jgi:hypothetical protein
MEEGRKEHGLEPKILYPDEKRESVALISRLYPPGIVWSLFLFWKVFGAGFFCGYDLLLYINSNTSDSMNGDFLFNILWVWSM